MSHDAVLAVVLCEDTQTECFIRRFLLKRDWDRRQIRTETQPAASSAAQAASTLVCLVGTSFWLG